MTDQWIEQEDVMERVANPAAWSEDTVPVFHQRISYIENYIGFLLPLGPRQIVSSLSDKNWGQDVDRAKFKIDRRSANHFLSSSFRKFYHLTRQGDQYLDSQRREAARNRSSDIALGAPHIQESLTLVRRDLLSSFLREKRQSVMYCFRSHRFSERTPNELNLEPKYETFQDETWHYVKEYRDISHGQNIQKFTRARMRTFSFLFGKSSCPSQILT